MARSLVKISSLIESGALAINDGYRVRNSQLGRYGFPFVRGGDIRGGEVMIDVEDHVLPQYASDLQNKLVRPGDVAFITKGTVGRVGRVREGAPPFVFAPQVCFWRTLNHDVIHPGFLFYLLQSDFFQANLDAVKTHGSMVADYVSLADQRNFRLPLPEIVEQRRIAEILGALDDKIDLNRRMNETLEATARTLFGAAFANDDHIAEWRVSTLDRVARFTNGLALQKFPAKVGDPGLPVIKIAQLRAGHTGGADVASSRLAPDYIVTDGDLLFSWSGSLECVIWTGGRGALNQHLFKVTSEVYPQWYVYFWIHKHLPEFRHIASSKATTMGHIQRHHLHEAEVVVPDEATLRRLDDVIAPLISRTVANRLESRTLGQLRDTLLPKLLSGEIRVATAEKELAGRM